MKKNIMMRAASALLVATLLSTCTISGTYAKYVTSDSAEDTARVAKWGIVVQASGNLFGTDYNPHSATIDPDEITISSSASVSSMNGNKIVAPGTKNDEGFTISVTGTPEVAYSIDADYNGKTIEDIFLAEGEYGVMVKATGLNAASNVNGYYTLKDKIYSLVSDSTYTAGTDYYELHDYVNVTTKYYPINWAVANSGKATYIDTTKDLTVVIKAMVDEIDKLGVSNAKSDSYAKYILTWAWPFESGNDGADTILGNLIVNGGTLDDESMVVKKSGDNYTSELTDGADYNLEIAFGLDVTVTQVD